MDNNNYYYYVKYYLDPTWQQGAMAWTPILVMWSLWPWARKYDIGYKSWHNLWLWSTYVENIIDILYGVKEL